MGKGPDTSQSEKITQQQIDIAKSQESRATSLFNLTEPGLGIAEKYYTALSTGDPQKLWTSFAPATQAITEQNQAAKQNIDLTMPRGGEQRIAKEMSDVAAGTQISRGITQSYLGSFPALATLAGQGIGLSINEAANAIAALGGASQTQGNILQAEASGKASTMGFLGSLAGAGGAIGAAAIPACWIAAALWGEYDVRTKLVRRWLNEIYGKRPVGWFVVALYRLNGRRVARWVKKYAWLRRFFTPVFETALARAGREVKAYG